MLREIVLDTETTGLSTDSGHRIIEIGCVELINRISTGNTFHRYINPERDIPYHSFKIHGISEEFIQDKPLFSDIAQHFLDFISDSVLVIHNAAFDVKFLNIELNRVNAESINFSRVIDTLPLARKKFAGSPASLDALCKRFNISLEDRKLHGALVDAKLLARVYVELQGGLQTLLFSETGDQNEKPISAHCKSYNLIDRKHLPNIDEVTAHKKLLKQIKSSLWKEVLDNLDK